MKAMLLTFLVLSVFVSSSQSTDDCACCSPEYRQFDFWIGEWVVKNRQGDILGYNTLSKQEEGCMLAEYWRSEGGGTGRSTNYFDKADSTWNQLWVSSSGHILKLKGKLMNGSMVLQSEVKSSEQGTYKDRITWTPQDDGTVLQKWDLLTPDGAVIKTAFEGIYYPEEK